MNAREAAEKEMERLDEISKVERREKTERMEKADLRHKEALNKEVVKREYDNLLMDLSNLQVKNNHIISSRLEFIMLI